MIKVKAEHKHLKEWVDLYNSGKSIRQIANDYNVAMTTVKRRIKGHIEIRPKSPYLKYAKEWLDLYESGMKKSDIARQYDVPPTTVGKILSKVGVKTNGNKKYLHLIEDMKTMYSSGMSLNDISIKLGISAQAISNYLEHEDIDRRPYTEACRIFSINEEYFKLIDDEDKAFTVGMLWSLGNIVYDEGIPRNIRVVTTKKELIEFLINKIYIDKKTVEYKASNNAYVEDIFCEGMMSHLISIGFSNKNNKKIPNFKSLEIMNSFIDGVLYTKLNISINNRYRAYIKSSELELSEILLKHLINSIGINKDSIKKIPMPKKNTSNAYEIYKKEEVKKLIAYSNNLEKKYIKKLDF